MKSCDYIEVNHTTHYNTGDDCGHCDDFIEMHSKAADFSISVHIEKNKIDSEYYRIEGVNFHGNPIVLENYTLNNKKYDQIKIYENAGSNSKLFVARNFGVVGFIDENGEEWMSVEDNINKQIVPIVINSSCE